MLRALTFVFVVLALGCICMPGGGTCSVLDKRFTCSGVVTDEGIKLTFSGAPDGKFIVGRTSLEMKGEGSVDCQFKDGNFPAKDSTITLTCIPKKQGDYTLNFDIKHSEPTSYIPHEGETCLKSTREWSCTTKGHYSFTSDAMSEKTTTTFPPVPRDKDTCEAAGGKWGQVGLYPHEICNMPTPDGGKTCSDESDCMGSCFAENEGDKTGKCTEWTTVVGCNFNVENGKVTGKMCRD